MAYERYGQADDDRRDQDRDRPRGSDYYGAGEVGYQRSGYGQRDGGQGGYAQGSYGRRDGGARDASPGYGQRDDNQQRGSWGQDRYRDRFTGGDDYYRPTQGRDDDRSAYGRQEQGRHDQEQRGGRGFVERAGDEFRSWFGDEQAERRREQDARDTERQERQRDAHYHDWRDQQIASFDRDYHEYRQENQQKFHAEFSSWRTERQGQRDLLGRVQEHHEVVGSDGEHVGTVDKVRGDQLILTKSDPDAGGRHHGVPSRWIKSVDDKVTLTKTAAEAKQQWQDAERQGAMFGGQPRADDKGQTAGQTGATDLNRSFSGTY